MAIVGRFTAQLCVKPKFTFALRHFVYNEDLDMVLDACEILVKTLDQILHGLYAGGQFTAENVKDRVRKVENASRSALACFQHYTGRLQHAFFCDVSINIEMLDSIEKMFQFEWGSIAREICSGNFLQMVSLNEGRDLPITPIETIVQVSHFPFFEYFIISCGKIVFSEP